MRGQATLSTMLLLLSSTCSQAASFDCSKAASWAERAICDDPALSRLDDRLSQRYRAVRSALSDAPEKADLLAEQRQWLERRNACTDTLCLSRIYEDRIAALAQAGDRQATTATPSEGRISHSGQGYSVSAAYPVFSDPRLAGTNDAIRAFVESLTSPFLKEHTDEGSDNQPPDMPPWSLEIGYATPYQTGRYVAIAFSGYDYRGGAHGMPIIEPLVLSLPDGEPVPPEGLFKPGSHWLQALSAICYQALGERDLITEDDDWLKTGTAPNPDNYRWLYPGPEGLSVTFPPYAVAPYAAGPQTVLIAYDRLSGLLNPGLFGR